jgi:heptosyltransferase-2
MTSTRRIAVIAPNWLGDAVMSLPLIGMLGACAGISLSLVCPELTARVYWGLDEVDELVVLSKRGLTHGVSARTRYLSGDRPDVVIILPPSLSSAIGPALAGVRARVGFTADRRGGLLTDGAPADPTRSRHLSEEFVSLGKIALARLGLQPPVSFSDPPVRVAESDSDGLETLLGARGISGAYAVVVPGATFGPAKSWPWKRYREVARQLSRDLPVILAGTAPERELCETIASGDDGIHNLAGETPIGLFLALLEGAAAVLANDSGTPHLAASLGAPVVVLFGSTSPDWTAPLGRSVDVVRFPVHCSPCFRKTCPTQLECFDGITTELVLTRVQRLL